ncbi:MAG: pseudaminic acid cytidylyltransferase [Hyphomicrobiaceae bacterium]
MRIAVIPARGGSKRIHKKNIRLFCGRPIIAYSIAAAIEANLFDHVIVSTDDDEIAEAARSHGAEVPFVRPSNLADDFTGTNAVVAHAVLWYRDRGYSIDHTCCIYATAPMLDASYLREGLRILMEREKTFAFSITSFPFPIQRAVRLLASGGIEPTEPHHMTTRSQDLETLYHDAGQFYWGTAEAFVENRPLFAPHSAGVVIPRHMVQDIDTIEDWERAELMYIAWRGTKSPGRPPD